jgi:hypothetical protein
MKPTHLILLLLTAFSLFSFSAWAQDDLGDGTRATERPEPVQTDQDRSGQSLDIIEGVQLPLLKLPKRDDEAPAGGGDLKIPEDYEEEESKTDAAAEGKPVQVWDSEPPEEGDGPADDQPRTDDGRAELKTDEILLDDLDEQTEAADCEDGDDCENDEEEGDTGEIILDSPWEKTDDPAVPHPR